LRLDYIRNPLLLYSRIDDELLLIFRYLVDNILKLFYHSLFKNSFFSIIDGSSEANACVVLELPIVLLWIIQHELIYLI